MSDVTTSRKRMREPVLCLHCNRLVLHSTFYRHKARFYDTASDSWDTGRDGAAGSNSSSDSEVELNIDPVVEIGNEASNIPPGELLVDCKLKMGIY